MELAAALTDLGHDNEVHAMVRAVDGGSVHDLPVLVPSTRLDARSYLRATRRLRQLLADRPADVVLAHGGSAALVVALAAPGSSARVWQRILGFPTERWGPVRRLPWRAVAHRFDGVVALTPELEAEVRALGYAGPAWVIPNARAPERFAAVDRAAASAALRADLGIDGSVPLIGWVAHLVDQKHPEAAVDLLAEVRRRGTPAHLVMAGDGPLRTAVEGRIEAHGLRGAVTLLGHRDDPEWVFGGIDVALITSRAEGIPGVAIEAQMAGCPVVSVPVGGVAEVVDHGVTGMIATGDDVAALADAVEAVLEDPERRHALGIAARAHAAEFTMGRVAPLYAAACALVVKDSGYPS